MEKHFERAVTLSNTLRLEVDPTKLLSAILADLENTL